MVKVVSLILQRRNLRDVGVVDLDLLVDLFGGQGPLVLDRDDRDEKSDSPKAPFQIPIHCCPNIPLHYGEPRPRSTSIGLALD